MTPLLYPILLLIICEISTDDLTKWVSRVMLYIYAISMVILTYLPTSSETLFSAMIVSVIGYSVLLHKIGFIRIRVVVLTLLILQIINYLSVIYNDFTLVYSIPYYFEHSNIVLRELSVIAVTSCCIKKGVDSKLKIGILLGYIMEYFYLINT